MRSFKNTGRTGFTKSVLLFLFGLSVSTFLGGSFSHDGHAQSRDMDNRLDRIENEIQTLNRAIYKGETPPPGSFSSGGNTAAVGNLEVRMQQLETELRETRGLIEEQNFEIRQMKDRLERSLSDMELRLGDLEGGNMNGAPSQFSNTNTGMPAPDPSMRRLGGQPQMQGDQGASQINPASGGYTQGNSSMVYNPQGYNTPASTGGAASQSASAQEFPSGDRAAREYEEAFSLLKGGNYASAARGFQGFIDAYPNHALAANAKYWLGEAYYVRGDFETSARIFAEGYQKYPKGAKAPDNLLKLGLSLNSLGKTDDACIALGQIEKDYSGTAVPVLRRAKQEMERLGCV